ncbi:MAG: diguanylate cyclase [Chloroflexi bacterium]|nr:diguanylate cyclase [Chloroflexota bacterium]
MDWGLTFLVGTLAAASGISLSLAVFAARRRAAPGARSYAVLMVAIAYWTAAVAGQLLSSDFAGRALWLKLQYPGVVLAAPAALVFILSFSGRANWITRRQLAFLAVEPLITLLLIATNDAHGLFWSFITPDDTTFPGLLPIPGAWGRLRLPYIFLMQLAGGMIILEMFSRSSPRYRRQAMVFGLGGVFPWISGVMTYGGINPFGTLNLAPFGFTLAGLFWGWGLFRWGLFDIVPVARYLVIEGMRDIVLVLDAKDRIVDLNPAAQRFLGVSAADAIGQAAATALPAWSGPLRGNDGAVSGALLHLGGGDAEERTLELLISPLDDGLGGQLGRLVVAYDVTQRVRAEAALERLALNDALTGLPNRTLLARRLSETLGKAGAAAAPCALLMMDLDGFKEVNDTFGHQVGDGLLRHVGQRLQAAALAGETPARLGGDEFAVLLPNVEGTEAATQAAQRMLAALEAPFLVEDMPLTVGASIGIALYPQHGDDANGLLRSADVAMYAAKRAGGGWAVYDPDADTAVR